MFYTEIRRIKIPNNLYMRNSLIQKEINDYCNTYLFERFDNNWEYSNDENGFGAEFKIFSNYTKDQIENITLEFEAEAEVIENGFIFKKDASEFLEEQGRAISHYDIQYDGDEQHGRWIIKKL